MKIRHVFSTPDLDTAQAVMNTARGAGVDNDDILLVARSDIELEDIPNERKEADTDLIPAALRGAGYGGAAGLLAGLAAVVLTPIGLTLAGAAAATVAGAAVGCWASALVGSSIPDPIRRKFDAEIQSGRILVVLDGKKEFLDALESTLIASGATPLPYESTKAMA
ncbi:hypothetical protein MNR01_13725 [Lysobacter sp. S4-A87]|uniref:hypothetical protein n=1 Tax=Lysobacter sp. S4-A87 TaxID=2925843 RepID=UPI001F539B3F|nr:hypothetical protein [Lysobacter sp. S4-A87]UNK48792.1 hypothetical protein MNR01_13725 [Lysobacter sp. S4-A87]